MRGMIWGFNGHGKGTIVKIWAPSALRIFFRLYQSPQEGNPIKEFQLLPDESGTWIYEIRENLEGFFFIHSRSGTGLDGSKRAPIFMPGLRG